MPRALHLTACPLLVAVALLAPVTSSSPLAQAPPAAPPPPAVKVGDEAPDFTLPLLVAKADGGFERRQIRLADYRGKQNVVVAFFPAAFSPGCTNELARFREKQGAFNETNTVILGVSVDSVWANKAFREQLGLDFPVLSDTRREVSRKYGVYDEQNDVARRTTFVVDRQGIVRHVDQQRDATAHVDGAIEMCRLIRQP